MIDLPHPNEKPVWWLVYPKRPAPGHSGGTKVFTRFWFDARRIGSADLGLDPDEVTATETEKE